MPAPGRLSPACGVVADRVDARSLVCYLKWIPGSVSVLSGCSIKSPAVFTRVLTELSVAEYCVTSLNGVVQRVQQRVPGPGRSPGRASQGAPTQCERGSASPWAPQVGVWLWLLLAVLLGAVCLPTLYI